MSERLLFVFVQEKLAAEKEKNKTETGMGDEDNVSSIESTSIH